MENHYKLTLNKLLQNRVVSVYFYINLRALGNKPQ